MPKHGETHFGRHWPIQYKCAPEDTIENRCPCRKAPCGHVPETGIDPNCPQHSFMAGKTMRSIHFAEDCPGADQWRTEDEDAA